MVDLKNLKSVDFYEAKLLKLRQEGKQKNKDGETIDHELKNILNAEGFNSYSYLESGNILFAVIFHPNELKIELRFKDNELFYTPIIDAKVSGLKGFNEFNEVYLKLQESILLIEDNKDKIFSILKNSQNRLIRLEKIEEEFEILSDKKYYAKNRNNIHAFQRTYKQKSYKSPEDYISEYMDNLSSIESFQHFTFNKSGFVHKLSFVSFNYNISADSLFFNEECLKIVRSKDYKNVQYFSDKGTEISKSEALDLLNRSILFNDKIVRNLKELGIPDIKIESRLALNLEEERCYSHVSWENFINFSKKNLIEKNAENF